MVPLNAVAVAVVLLMALRAPSPAYEGTDYEGSNYVGSSGLVQDGESIRDIRPVDAAGNPLTGVYLFDQDGRPIDAEEYECEGSYDASGSSTADPVRPYPRGTWEVEPDNGRCVLVPPAPLVVAVPTATGSAAPTAAQPGVPLPTTASAPVEPTAVAPVVPPTPTG